jgi:hypothetical protein
MTRIQILRSQHIGPALFELTGAHCFDLWNEIAVNAEGSLPGVFSYLNAMGEAVSPPPPTVDEIVHNYFMQTNPMYAHMWFITHVSPPTPPVDQHGNDVPDDLNLD